MPQRGFSRFFLRVTACRPHRAWGIALYSLTALVVLMSVAGALVPR